MTDADLANTATDFNPTGYIMGQLRTADERGIIVPQALVAEGHPGKVAG